MASKAIKFGEKNAK